METIITFLGAHWIWFLVIAILLIFALIGYFVDSNSIEEDRRETMKVESINNKVEGVETLSTVNETANVDTSVTETLDNQTQGEVLDTQSNEIDAPQDDVIKQEQTTANTEQLIQENISNESTFQG